MMLVIKALERAVHSRAARQLISAMQKVSVLNQFEKILTKFFARKIFHKIQAFDRDRVVFNIMSYRGKPANQLTIEQLLGNLSSRTISNRKITMQSKRRIAGQHVQLRPGRLEFCRQGVHVITILVAQMLKRVKSGAFLTLVLSWVSSQRANNNAYSSNEDKNESMMEYFAFVKHRNPKKFGEYMLRASMNAGFGSSKIIQTIERRNFNKSNSNIPNFKNESERFKSRHPSLQVRPDFHQGDYPSSNETVLHLQATRLNIDIQA